MTKTFYILLFFIVVHLNSFSQSTINDYKYIIIPNQYEFLKSQDQYQLNSLTKFLFNKYGYEAYMQDEKFPEDLYENRCLGLVCDVFKENAFLKTKLRIDLKDCDGNVVASSEIGETREKEYSKAYNLALRDAFKTFQNMNYSYKPNAAILAKENRQTSVTRTDKKQDEITRLKEEIKTLKEEQVQPVVVKEPILETKIIEKQKEELKPKESIEPIVQSAGVPSGTLYAQPIDNGFQIVDTTPKKVMILLNSGVQDVYKVKGKKAIVYKKGDDWMYSESGDIMSGTVINIKF